MKPNHTPHTAARHARPKGPRHARTPSGPIHPAQTGRTRSLSLFLCLVMLIVSLQTYFVSAFTGSFSVAVYHEGSAVDRLTLPEDERANLRAVCSPAPSAVVYQWQILADIREESWVNIYDGTEQELKLSYAMVQTLLDSSGSVYVRCRAAARGEVSFSAPVCVTVEFMPPYDSDGTAAQTAVSRPMKTAVRRAAADPAGEDNGELFVSITIHYLDAVSGLPIYSAYTGQVNVSVDGYKATVISPTYLGYAPFYNKNDPAATLPADGDVAQLFPDSAATIELDIPQGYTGSEYVIRVYYAAIDVPYAVRYYFQNIHDDQYTEDVGLYVISTAKTGTIISDQKLAEFVDADHARGFTKLYHHPEAVAADGSTVFQCYYDRSYSLLKFDCDGGYGTEPIYARYATPFLVNEPTRPGYVFMGWDRLDENGSGDGIADTLPTTVPEESCTYRAIWKTTNSSYHIAYWLQHADDDDYAYIGTIKQYADSDTKITAADCPALSADTPICGNEESGHTHQTECYPSHLDRIQYDAEKNQDTVVTVHGNGSTIINVYYTRKYYTLRFIYAKEYNASEDYNTNRDPNNTLTGVYYSVVGNSTYGFGNKKDGKDWFQSNSNYTLDALLQHTLDHNGSSNADNTWGGVKELPVPKNPMDGVAYVTGTYPAAGQGYKENGASGNYNQLGDRYHYFEITARYGANLTELWPADVFDKVPVTNPEKRDKNNAANYLTDTNGVEGAGWGNYAYLAGWNGEYKVQYSLGNENSTVKGLYQMLDDTILLGAAYSYTDKNDGVSRQIQTKTTVGGQEVDSNACYFLGFFDNGANVSWSIPREWIYESYVPVFSNELTADQITRIKQAAKAENPADKTYTDPDTGKIYYYYAANDREKGDNTEAYEGIYRLYDRVVTSDDNTKESKIDASKPASGQTQTALAGFDFEELNVSQGINRRYEQFENGTLTDQRLSYTSRFFYIRKSYTYTLHSHNELYGSGTRVFDGFQDQFMTADGKLITPSYPTTLEENAYSFDGWYSSPECLDGTEYVPGIQTKMPAHNVSYYAKWTPKVHTVRFFRTYDDMLRYEATGDESGLLLKREIAHRLVLDSVENPTDDFSGYHYAFGGWFYEQAGKRQAYTPLDTPILRDMNVYAGWGSLTAQPYRIRYAQDDPERDAATEAALLAATDGKPMNNQVYTVTVGEKSGTYVYLESDGRFHLCIAEDAEGFAYQGSTRTFVPKVGSPYNQLNNGYNSGYFPTLASHSLTLSYEEDKANPQNNLHTFTYVHKEKVEYRVEYRYADTNELIADAPGGGTVHKETADAVVTERFAVLEGYLPDAFYKRLILAVERNENGEYVSAASNVIVFYYSRNTANAYYAVHYMLQNADAPADLTRDDTGRFVHYTESAAHTEGIGNVGGKCDIPPQTFSGFTVSDTALVDNKTTAGELQELTIRRDDGTAPCFRIEVSKDGTELYIFYTRNIQNYRVYHLQYGTDISALDKLTYTDGTNGVLQPIESATAPFGTTVTRSAETVSIGGMTCISPLTQSLYIRANDAQNYIIFYYTPVQTTIEYKVWSYGGGTLDTTLEVFNGKPATVRGSKPTALAGYTFAGWYLDEACTQPVTGTNKGTIEEDNRLIPASNYLDVIPQVNVFYAKFLPENGSLTIVRENGTEDESNGTQVFVYRIRAKNDPDYTLYVTIVGSGSVTIQQLPCREYTVEQQNDWSWRYDDPAQADVTVMQGGTSVTFREAPVSKIWLNGHSSRKTNRRG